MRGDHSSTAGFWNKGAAIVKTTAMPALSHDVPGTSWSW